MAYDCIRLVLYRNAFFFYLCKDTHRERERTEYQGKSVQHRAKARDKLSFKVNPPPKPSIQRNLQLLQLVS